MNMSCCSRNPLRQQCIQCLKPRKGRSADDDIRDLSWLRNNRRRYGIDPTRCNEPSNYANRGGLTDSSIISDATSDCGLSNRNVALIVMSNKPYAAFPSIPAGLRDSHFYPRQSLPPLPPIRHNPTEYPPERRGVIGNSQMHQFVSYDVIHTR